MSPRPLVLLTDVADLDPAPALGLLDAAGFDTLVLDLGNDPRVRADAGRAVAAIAGYAALGEPFFAALPDLGFIATASMGTDMVDSEAAARHGVRVQPLVGAATEEVAVHALALLLSLERRLVEASASVAAGEWSTGLFAVPRRLSNLTLGLFGLGKIGSELARIAAPIVGRVIAVDPFVRDAPPGVDELVTFETLLAQSDVLSLHVPLTPQTRGVIDAVALAALPDGAVLLNVSRGELVDQDALRAALDSGHLAGAGLDVLDMEPPRADHPLRSHARAIVTPHMGFLSREALLSYETLPAEAVVAWWRESSAS